MYFIFDPDYDSDDFQAVLKNPDSLLASKKTSFLKQDDTTTLGVVSIDGHTLAIKRYNIKGFFHAIKRAIRPSRAAISWSHAKTLLNAKILTPRPIAMIEKRYGPFRSTAYFVNEYVHGEHVRDYLNSPAISETQKKQVAENIIQLIRKFKEHGIVHGDMKPENILIVNEQPILLDLDGMRVYRKRGWYFQREHQKDIRRFMKNWVDYPEIQTLFLKLT